MMHTLLIYSSYQYGKAISILLTEKFVEEYPFMSGYCLAVMVPDKIINRRSLAPGLLENYPNHGEIVK